MSKKTEHAAGTEVWRRAIVAETEQIIDLQKQAEKAICIIIEPMIDKCIDLYKLLKNPHLTNRRLYETCLRLEQLYSTSTEKYKIMLQGMKIGISPGKLGIVYHLSTQSIEQQLEIIYRNITFRAINDVEERYYWWEMALEYRGECDVLGDLTLADVCLSEELARVEGAIKFYLDEYERFTKKKHSRRDEFDALMKTE